MTSRGPWTGRSRSAAALLVFALFLRLLVPTGWMPAEGEIGIRPCLPVAAPEAVAQPMDGHGGHHAAAATHHAPQQGPEEQGHGQAQPCAFGVLATALLQPPPPDGPLATLVHDHQPANPHDLKARPSRLLAAPPPPATGPPLLA